MPYKVEKKGGQWCVVKKATGRVLACHDSEAKAQAQIAAIGIHEHKKADDALAFETRADRPAAKVQSVLVPRKGFDRDQAKAWAKAHGFKSASVEETEDFFRLRQFEPDKCESTPRTITLDPKRGIKAVVCRTTSAKAEDGALEVRELEGSYSWTRADIQPGSVKKDADGSLLLRMRLASSTPVRRVGYLDGGFEEFEEVLSFEPGAHRGGRLESGRAPLLAVHREYDLSSILGVLFDPRETNTGGFEGFLECSARVSARAELEGVRGDIAAGILTNVSVGYRVFQYRDITERPVTAPGQPPPAARPMRRLLAIDWESREGSLLPVGADPTASVRSGTTDEPHEVVLWSPQTERKMEPETEPASGATATVPPPAQPATPPAPAARAPAPAQPAPVAPAVDAGAAELNRQRAIRDKLRRQGIDLDGKLARSLLDNPVPMAEATDRILESLATRADGAPESSAVIPAGGDDADKAVRAIEDALTWRACRSQLKGKELEDLKARLQGNPYVHHRLLRIGEDYLGRVHGMRDLARYDPLSLAGLVLDTRRNPGAIQTRAVPAFHVTADFASVLANIANKALQRQYDMTPDTYSQWVNFGELSDFKQGKRVNLGDAPRLLRKYEGAEIVMGAVGEKGEPVQLTTWARGLTISRESLVNDDLGAFTRFPRAFGSSAKQLVADLVYLILTGNAALADGFNLFDDTNHGNYVTGTGNSLSAAGVAALSAVRQRARRQKGIAPGNNETAFFLRVDLPHLRVPENLETAAQQLTTSIQAQQVGNVNPFQGAFQSVMAEPRLGAVSQAAFYMMADPAAVETVEVDFLQGEAGPQIESRMSWSAEGVEMKCRLDVGVAAVEFRGLYKNDGTT